MLLVVAISLIYLVSAENVEIGCRCGPSQKGAFCGKEIEKQEATGDCFPNAVYTCVGNKIDADLEEKCKYGRKCVVSTNKNVRKCAKPKNGDGKIGCRCGPSQDGFRCGYEIQKQKETGVCISNAVYTCYGNQMDADLEETCKDSQSKCVVSTHKNLRKCAELSSNSKPSTPK